MPGVFDGKATAQLSRLFPPRLNVGGFFIAAALGIAVIEGEGAAVEAILASDIASPNIGTALDLLENPKRLIATLRV